jgi:hypothetical protein
MQTLSKIYEFVKIWWKILVSVIFLLSIFLLVKKLGLSFKNIIQIVRDFLKPPKNSPQTSEKISERVVEINESDAKNTGAQRISEKAVQKIDELLYELQNRK